LADPVLYTGGQINSEFSVLSFILSLMKGFAYGLSITGLIFFSFGASLTEHGFTTDLWLNGSICYTAVVLLVTSKILYESHTHTRLSLLLIVLSVLAYYSIRIFLSNLPFDQLPDIMTKLYDGVR
jgi:hypothetical protein